MIRTHVPWKPAPQVRWKAHDPQDERDPQGRYVRDNTEFGQHGFDPDNPQHLAGLRRSLDHAYRAWRKPREMRHEFAKQLAGAHYADEGTDRRIMQNYIGMFIAVHMRHLVANNPRVVIVNKSAPPELAADLEPALNKRIAILELGDALAEAAFEAMFGLGVLKLGRELCDDGIERTFAACVDLDDLYVDATATKWDHIDFVGDRTVVPFESIYYSKTIGRKARDQIKPEEPTDIGPDGSERTSSITSDPSALHEPFMRKTELFDVWLPHYRQIVTLAKSGNVPVNVVDWPGPVDGPYHILYYEKVPSQLVPLAPLHAILEVHYAQNMVSRKLRGQAKRQKTVHGVSKTAETDAPRLVEAADGEAVCIDRPNEIQAIKTGGVDQPLLAYSLHLKDLFSWLGGNINALGGLSTGAETLGQDKLLFASASAKLADMQSKVVKFTRRVVQDIAYHDVHDPLLYVDADKPVDIPSVGQIPISVRMLDYADILTRVDLQIDPYSMTDRSPSERIAVLWQYIKEIAGTPWAMAQGLAPDMRKLTDLVARYENMPELRDILIGVPQQAMAGEQPGMPQNTRREYVRTNRAGASEEGKNRNLVGSLMGARQNQDEEAGMFRDTG